MMKKKVYFILGGCFVFLVIVMFIFRTPFVSEYTLEAGDQLEVKNLLKDDVEASFITSIDESITKSVGVHDIQLSAKGTKYTVKINTVDTVAPKAKVKNITTYLNDSIDPQAFIESIDDQTKVKASISNKIDNTKEGKQNVELLFTDEGDNQTKLNATVTIKKDTQGPVIQTPQSFSVEKGGTISYKKDVTVTDNRDGEITNYNVDSSKVNLNKIGLYQVTYSAEDQLKNKTTKVVQVRVTSYDVEKVKKEADKYAQKILNKIINDKMTKSQKVKAIYEYVRDSYTYVGEHKGTETDFYLDALNGFKTYKGDCYVVNAMARYLLEKVDIETYGVKITTDKTNHLSFMANIGDGWYHYCAFKKKSGLQIYKWTDAQIMDHYKSIEQVISITKNLPATPKK